MRFPLFACFLWLSAAPGSARTLVGHYGDWATFCDGPRRCLAVTQAADRDHPATLAVLFGSGAILVRSEVALRSARLTIDGQHFALATDATGAHAPDVRAARAIVQRLRAADSAALDARTVRGTRLHQRYRLRGAPTAIDAAALASLPEGGKYGTVALDR